MAKRLGVETTRVETWGLGGRNDLWDFFRVSQGPLYGPCPITAPVPMANTLIFPQFEQKIPNQKVNFMLIKRFTSCLHC